MLRVEALGVRYGVVTAVHDCSLDLQDGQCLAVLGSNGAGKSSLLRAIARTVRPSAGHIWLGEDRIDRWSPDHAARSGIALVPEGRRLFAALTVRENLLVGGARLRKGELNGQLERILEWFPELAERLEVKAGRLSGGEQQMVSVGRALMGRPRILLIDELSLGLAPMVTRRIYAILAQVVASGVGLIVVEQYADLAIAAADQVLVLDKGRVAFRGSPHEVRLKPDLLEAAYLGSDLMAGDTGSSPERSPSSQRARRTRAASDDRKWPAVAEVLVHLPAPAKRRMEEEARLAGMDLSDWVGGILSSAGSREAEQLEV